MPINTAGYSSQHAPSSYSANGISTYTNEGIVYIYAGCRGRNEGETDYSTGAPWGVTDLKAALRFVRYNALSIPGNHGRTFTFGMSGGGAQSAIVGASGDSELYTPYLEAIGAVMKDDNGNTISDAVCGSMCWCPITNLDVADAAYEWNMGQYMTTGTREEGTFTKELSTDLAYYDYVKSIIEESLNNYIQDNNLSASDYISNLNSNSEWVTYDSSTKKATITSIKDFVTNCKSATKNVGAFDDLSRSQAENKLFGNDTKSSLHFDKIMANLLKTNTSKYSALSSWKDTYASDYTEDLTITDKLGKDIEYRANMYNPMYYLLKQSEGYNMSAARYLRINTGITQGDTANVTEINLSLALQNHDNVKDAQFTTVWNQGHTTAERTGNSTDNFIQWIYECSK